MPRTATASYKPPAPPQPPSADLPRPRRKPHQHHLRRRFGRPKNPTLAGAEAPCRPRSAGPTTPLSRWKLHDTGPPPEPEKDCRSSAGVDVGSPPPPVVSARRFAAGLWHLTGGPELGIEPISQHLHFANACDQKPADLPMHEPMSPVSSHDAKNVFLRKKASSSLPNCNMKRTTKWDTGSSKPPEEVYRFLGNLNLLEDQQVTTVSIVSALQAELAMARSKIDELMDERQSVKKKLDHFLKKLAEEKESWRSREHEKVHKAIEIIKDELVKERRNRQRMEIINSKLINELAEAKLSAKRYLQDYEKERRARQLMEEVCDELAKEIGEDKDEADAFKREYMKIQGEVEEERRMLQMAEVWREERVQMKLVDAKILLEEKYSHLRKLQDHMESFLQVQGTDLNVTAVKQAEALREAVSMLKIPDIKEFNYQPPTSEDILSVFEELQPREEKNKQEIEQCCGYSPASYASKIYTASPETDIFLERRAKRYANRTMDGDLEEDSGWETMSHVEEQGYCNSPERSEPSEDGIYEESQASFSGADWDDNGDEENVNSEISEILSSTTKLSRNKGVHTGKLWRSSCSSNGDPKKFSAELSNGRQSNGTLTPNMKSGHVGATSPRVEQWSSPDSIKPHTTKATKGRIGWPRGIQKQSLNEKILDARVDWQKDLLRHALEQKT